MTEKTFKVRPEPVEGVEYNGPIEKHERKNIPHILEEDEDSIGVYRHEEQVDPAWLKKIIWVMEEALENEREEELEIRISSLFNKTQLCKDYKSLD